MVILKGILIALLGLAACLVLLALATTLILDSADSIKTMAELSDLRKENAQLKKLLDKEIKANEEMFQQIKKTRMMP